MRNGKTQNQKKQSNKMNLVLGLSQSSIVVIIGSALGGGGKDKNKDSSSKSTAASKSSSNSKALSSSSEKRKSGWTQEIYDSIVSATANFNNDGTMA